MMNKRLILQNESMAAAPKCISILHSIFQHFRLWAAHKKMPAFLALVIFLISQSASAALFLPTISNIADQTTDEDTPTTAIPFVIWDLLTPLPLLTVSASSSKQSLVPDANIVLGGSTGSRTARITPAPNQFGTTTIQISVTDLLGGVAIDTFVLTVKSVNDLPNLSHIQDQTIVENTATTPLPFAVSDLETPTLFLSVSGSSSDTTLVPDANIVFGGNGPNRSVTIMPATNRFGTAIIRIMVADIDGGAVSDSFALTISPTNYLPDISAIPAQTTDEGAATGAIPFSIGDVETLTSNLTLTGTSSNPTLVPDANIAFSGSMDHRTIIVTPAQDQFGTTTITIAVNDGDGGVMTTRFDLAVLAVNDAPTLDPLASLTINEDAPVQTVNLSGIGSGALNELQSLTVTAVSSDLTVIAQPTVSNVNANATGSLSFAPVPDANGQATITVTVDDSNGVNAVVTRSFTVTVLAVNDAPTLNSLASLTINEDAPVQTVNLTGIGSGALNELQSLRVTAVSSDLTVIVQPTVSYVSANSTGSLSFAPVPDANGQATITVMVDDGGGVNAVVTRSFTVTVLAVNDAPTLNPLASLTINEDAPMQTVTLSGIGSGALNELQSLRVTAVSSDLTVIAQPTVSYVSANATGSLSFAPVPDANGQATITVTVDDGSGVNPVVSRSFTVTVLAINDAPTLNPLASLTINEDAPMQTVTLTGIGSGALNELQSLRVTAVSSDLTVIAQPTVSYVSANATGCLSFAPVPDANGQATITVTVDDSNGVNAVVTRSFTVTVLAVNDAPTLNSLASLTINEDAPMQTVTLTGIGSGALNELQSLRVTAVSSDLTVIAQPTVSYVSANATGSLSFAPVPDANGQATITVTVDDSNGVNAVETRSFTVTVLAVNDAPTLNSLASLTINEDAPVQTVNLSGIGSGALNELQSLMVTAVSSDLTVIAQPTVSYVSANATGSLSFAPVPDANGHATITVTVDDSNGVNAVVTRSFTVTVLAVNDAPTLNSLANLTINEDAPVQTVTLTGIGSGALNELQSLRVTAVSSDLTVIAQPTVSYVSANSTGSLSFTPVPDANGQATITVTVDDGGGVNAVVTRSFTVTVLAVNDAPTLNPLASLTINEDAPMQTVTLTGIGSGALNEFQSLRVTAVSSDLSVIAQPTVSYVSANATGNLSFAPMPDANGQATITVTVDDGGGVNAVVTRSFTVTVLAINDAPTISNLTDQTINENTVTTGIPFRVADIETPLNKLKVTGSSSDTVLVPNANIVIVGNEGNRVLTIQPAANRAGTAKILITVDDNDGGVAVATFALTVKPVNEAPTLSDLGKQFTLEGQATSPITFTVGDVETDATSLKVTGNSSDINLVPNENLSFANGGFDRTLIITPAPGRNGTVTITLTVGDGIATTSKTFDLTISRVPPRITEQPVATTVQSGGDVTFFVQAGGSKPLNYRWTFNGSDIAGATGTNLTLSTVTPQQAGEYAVVITNAAGSTTSQVVALNVLSPPVITNQPRSQVVVVGSVLTLNVGVKGQGPFRYQWRVNGVNLKGGTDASLVIPNGQPVNSGDYSCAISNPYGAVNSEIATVVVAVETLAMTDNFTDRSRLLAPSGIGQSSNVGATQETREPRHAGKAGGKSMWISWVASADGIAKWETSGSSFDTLLAVYTGSSLGNLIEVASDEDSGGLLTSALKFNAVAGTEYEIAVDGFAGREGIIVLGWSFVPALEPLPEIVAEPQSQTVGVGANVLFSVVARGSGLSYQWFLNAIAIPGAIGPSYSITNVQMASVGSYRVRVTSSTQSVDSQAGVLQLNSNAGIADVRGIATTDKFADALTTTQASPLAPQAIVRRPAIRRSSNAVARGFTGTQIFSTVGSTKEEGEPNHCGEIGGASQWFAYQAEADAILTISTDGSDFDTVLAVYTGAGADFASLREVGCDNDSGADGKDSLVRIQAVAGTVYYIAVDGVHAATGNVRLNYSLAAPLRLSAARMENGQFRLSVNGQPGETYTIQGSVDLLTWFPLQTVQTPTGAIEIADTNSPNFRWRSYRAVKKPE